MLGYAIRNARFIGRGKQRCLDVSAGQAGCGNVRRSLDAGSPAGLSALHHQPLEQRVVLGGPAHTEFEQLLAVAGFSRDVFARAASEYQARIGIAAQKSGSSCIVDVQAFEQRIKGVAAASAFGAEKLEAKVCKCLGLCLGWQSLHGLQYFADW